jgi:hypothetical protein
MCGEVGSRGEWRKGMLKSNVAVRVLASGHDICLFVKLVIFKLIAELIIASRLVTDDCSVVSSVRDLPLVDPGPVGKVQLTLTDEPGLSLELVSAICGLLNRII